MAQSSWKGNQAKYAEYPSADKGKKASVDHGGGQKSSGASWKGKPSQAGALPKERQAIIKPSNIHDVKNDKKSTIGKSPS